MIKRILLPSLILLLPLCGSAALLAANTQQVSLRNTRVKVDGLIYELSFKPTPNATLVQSTLSVTEQGDVVIP